MYVAKFQSNNATSSHSWCPTAGDVKGVMADSL